MNKKTLITSENSSVSERKLTHILNVLVRPILRKVVPSDAVAQDMLIESPSFLKKFEDFMVKLIKRRGSEKVKVGKISDEQVYRLLFRLRAPIKNAKIDPEDFELLLGQSCSTTFRWDILKAMVNALETEVNLYAAYHSPLKTTIEVDYDVTPQEILNSIRQRLVSPDSEYEYVCDLDPAEVVYQNHGKVTREVIERWPVKDSGYYEPLDVTEFSPNLFHLGYEFVDLHTAWAYIQQKGSTRRKGRFEGRVNINTLLYVQEKLYWFRYIVVASKRLRVFIKAVPEPEKEQVHSTERFLLTKKAT